MISGRKTYVGIIAYNAEKTLERVWRDIPEDVDYVVLSDDGSADGTGALAKRLGIPVIAHERNMGYGENQKTCYKFMLADKPDADVFVMLHGDYQYDPKKIPEMVAMIAVGEGAGGAEVALGVRRENLRGGGMPVYKIIGNKLLNTIQNLVFGLRLEDYSTGYKAYSRRALEEIDFSANSNNFIFDEEINAQVIFRGMKIGMVDIETRYFEEASSVNFPVSVRYGLGTLLVLAKYLLAKAGLWKHPLFYPKR